MATAYVLMLDDAVLAPRLELMRRVCEPDTNSKPHITVRYPVRLVDMKDVAAYSDTVISSIRVADPGAFGLDGHEGGRCAVFLRCESDALEVLSYKPNYPDTVFHLTVYEGSDVAFGRKLLKTLQEFPWQLDVVLPPATKLTEIPIGRGSRKKREWAVDEDLLQQTAETAGVVALSNTPIDDWKLTQKERLDITRKICKLLHVELPQGHLGPSSTVETLEVLPAKPHQMSIFPTPGPTILDADSRGLWGAPHPTDSWQSGVFLTPPELASEVVRLALSYVSDPSTIRFGDPALGSGILYAVLLDQLGSTQVEAATGVELDVERARLTSQRWGRRGLRVLTGDFLTAQPVEKWSLVVANPPYVRSQDIDPKAALCWRSEIKKRLDVELGGRASLYAYFVLMAHEWLAEDAISAWLLPADYMETQYGSTLRDYLMNKVELLNIHTYETTAPRFENALVSSSVVVFRNRMPSETHEVHVSHGSHLDTPVHQKEIALQTLREIPKWRLALSDNFRSYAATDSGISIGDLFRIRRGIATGANSHFVVDLPTIAKFEIPKTALVPVLPRSRLLPGSGVVTAGPGGEPQLETSLFLIDSDLPLDRIADDYPLFYSYLKQTQKEVGSRTLVARRRPFYRQEQRPAPPIVASNMGKLSRRSGSPVWFVRNMSNATVLNNYIAMYPNADVADSIDAGQITLCQLHKALTLISGTEFEIFGRRYGGGLYKLEPGDLAKCRFSVETVEEFGLASLLNR